MKKTFQKNRVEPDVVPAQPDREPLCVPVPSGPKTEPQVDLVDEEQLCIPGPSGPKSEPQMDLVDAKQLCVPGPSGPKTKSQMKKELSMLQTYIPQSVSQLEECLLDSTLIWEPVTAVWHNVFIGDE